MTQTSAPLDCMTSPVSSAKLREFIAGGETLIKLNEIDDHTPFQDAGVDSLDFFNLIVAVEDAYGLVIPSDHLGQVNTLDKMALYLNERLP